MAQKEERGDVDENTQDGTVNFKGNHLLTTKRGGRKACSFVVASGGLAAMAYYAIQANILAYFTRKLHESTVKSANNVTFWVGTGCMTPILGAWCADILGRYKTIFIFFTIYSMGMSLLTLSVSLPALRPGSSEHAADVENYEKASNLQLAVFFGAIYLIGAGNGGTVMNISTIGLDQLDENHHKEKGHKYFNWYMFSIYLGIFLADTVLVYVQNNVGWALGYGLPTIGLLLSFSVFLAGTSCYRHRLPKDKESALKTMARVTIAAFRKWKVTIPNDPRDLYGLDLEEYASIRNFRINFTSTFRFLNKAAVKTGPSGPWFLCSVTEVEKTKQMFRMIIVLIATFIPSTVVAQVNTLFIRQSTTLNGHIGSFKLPPASLSGFVTISTLVSVVLYDKFFVRIMRKWTNNPRGITLLQRMGIGIVFHITIMITASLVERYRLSVANEFGLVENGGEIPLTMFILLPQFLLMGMSKSFFEVAKLEFFCDQAPKSMKSLGASYSTTSLGVGNFLSSFFLSTVSRITKKNDHHGWILNNLNAAHLDYYYVFLAILSFINFIFFLVVTKFYAYKDEVLIAEELEVPNSVEVIAAALEIKTDTSGSV